METDIDDLVNIVRLATELRNAIALPESNREELQNVLRAVAPCLSGLENDLRRAAAELLSALDSAHTARSHFSRLCGRDVDFGKEELQKLASDVRQIHETRHLLRDWVAWCHVRQRATRAGLSSLTELLEAGMIKGEEARDAFRVGYARWWLPTVLDSDPVLRGFRRFEHENSIKEFRELDDLVRTHAVGRVVSAIAHDLPPLQGVPRNSELGLLRHQMQLQRPSQTIRDMIGRMPQSFPKLAPCMLMSPLSVAQYLPSDYQLFDVVIFDEASQITTWDAVGAIARARQTIVVGDPKQLPPTNFFGRTEDDGDEVSEHEKDLESILDEARASGIPVRELKWHYRSRSESLIAFSNHYYYGNQLITFPSPKVEDRAVHLRKVPNGVYDRGKSRTNKIEADAVVSEAVSRMKRWLELAERERPTLGIITFNAQQQSLILDLLDNARRETPELEWYFSDHRVEPTIVKNLENVQGDERDVILFSITFWKDAAGKVAMDLGALNRDGGERRLNVAITRARQELVGFSGFTADQIDTNRTKATAVRHLKAFLDYADRGAVAISAQDVGSAGGFESPFEEAVASRLERRGWSVVPQIGISGFRIDLGIRHPDLPGAYLAGVECDGATYHRSATARDRDKIREQVLRGLGWDILRVWSTDWWFDPSGCADRLHSELENVLALSRAHHADLQQIATHWDMGHQVEEIEEIRDEDSSLEGDVTACPLPSSSTDRFRCGVEDFTEFEGAANPTPNKPHIVDAEAQRTYRITDLSGFRAQPDRFFDPEYAPIIRGMVDAIIETEAPLRVDVLAQRIARAHGWLRTGGRIRERIELQLKHLQRTIESSGEFVWKQAIVADIYDYRHPVTEGAQRSIAEMPLAELADLVIKRTELLNEPDPARELARFLGVERLAAVSRARLEEAIARARQHTLAGG